MCKKGFPKSCALENLKPTSLIQYNSIFWMKKEMRSGDPIYTPKHICKPQNCEEFLN